MNVQTATSRPASTPSGRAKKSNFSPAAAASTPPPSTPTNNGGERGERTETGSGPSRTWEPSDMHAPKHSHSKEIVFDLHASPAQDVQLVGDFTDWQKNPIKLHQTTEGNWRAKVNLQPGRHLYRYLVDGQWHDGPAQAEREPNAFGSSDLIINVA